MDCGFLRLPTLPELDTVSLAQDPILVILPEGHPYAETDFFPLKELEKEPFMLLGKGAKAEISEILERHDLHPHVHFTTWDDYAVMSMVEQGMGIAILPELILKRIPYRVVSKPLEIPAFREIAFALKDKATMSLANRRFSEYLRFRD